MPRYVTIRLDETTIEKCRNAAAEEYKSLNEWIADVLLNAVSTDAKREARERALRRLEVGFSLGGKPIDRRELYAEWAERNIGI